MGETDEKAVRLEEPRREASDAMTIVGLARRYGYNDVAGIPAQWEEFEAFERTLGEGPGLWFGVCDAFDAAQGTFRYTCGVRVGSLQEIPGELESIALPARNYVVFSHAGHISKLRETLNAIWGQYLPASSLDADDEAGMFELYDESFDPKTGLGGIEIWIPLKG